MFNFYLRLILRALAASMSYSSYQVPLRRLSKLTVITLKLITLLLVLSVFL